MQSVNSVGLFQIKQKDDNRCFDIPGASIENGGNLQTYSCEKVGNQSWELKIIEYPYYAIKALHSGKCLNVNGSGNVDQWDCYYGNNQQFKLIKHTNGTEIQLRGTTQCIDISSNQIGANINTHECSDLVNQRFDLLILPVIACLYDDVNYQGNSMCLPDVDQLNVSMLPNFSDKASSIKILGQKEITLYDQNDYNGFNTGFISSSLTLMPDINNKVSSLKMKAYVDSPINWTTKPGICRDSQNMYPRWTYKSITLDSCKTDCKNNQECQAFAHNGTACQLFGASEVNNAEVGAETSIISEGDSSQSSYTCHMKRDFNYRVEDGVCRVGNQQYPRWSNHYNTSFQCMKTCDDNPKCQGFAMSKLTNYCQLFGSDGQNDASSNGSGSWIDHGDTSQNGYKCYLKNTGQIDVILKYMLNVPNL